MRIDIPTQPRRDENIAVPRELEEIMIVLIGEIEAIEQRVVLRDRSGGVDRRAIGPQGCLVLNDTLLFQGRLGYRERRAIWRS